MAPPSPFVFEHAGTELRYGRGRVADLGPALADRGLGRALVVTGSNVGANPDVMGPIEAGLGDRLAGVFDGTTPAKRAGTVSDGIAAMRDAGADALVGVGGGSSLDIARQISAFAGDDRSLADLRAEFEAEGRIVPPDPDDPTPVAVVPTTFAGADVSGGGSIEVFPPESSPTGHPVRTGGAVDPFLAVHDPALFATTPRAPFAGSAMNGFNKGIETLYARTATPITDATAGDGLSLLAAGLPSLGESEGLERAVVGTVLVQFERRTSIIHAFGHGFARRYDLQQGVAHAVVTPAVLRHVFGAVDARRDRIARALGVDADRPSDAVAGGIVEAVAGIRDALDLPARLRALGAVERDHLPAIAEFVDDDIPEARLPAGLDPTVEDLEGVLRAAW
ncbi:MAG: iron-containing alcohol dehydrogenase family protein [Halobacteriales archaeon]